MPETVIDVDALYSALDGRRQATRMSWRSLAHELGITPSTFTRMAQGRRPDIDTFATLIRWMGLPAETFMRPLPGDAMREDVPDSAATISAFLRADRHLSPKGAAALEELIGVMYRTLRETGSDEE